jgi:hypothetical protein
VSHDSSYKIVRSRKCAGANDLLAAPGAAKAASIKKQEISMSGKKAIVVTCTALALVLGAASAALAGNDDDRETAGGYAVGPLGQQFAKPPESGGAYGLAQPSHKEVRPRAKSKEH